ncbi:unnamed protein product [Cunninghamella blakesleeana]
MNTDEAVLELIFNPEAQGVPFESVAQSIQNNPLKAIEPEKLEKLQKLEKEAIELAEKEDLDGALKVLNQCIDLEPEYASAYNNRAQIHRMKNDTDKAMEDLGNVIKYGEGQPKVLRQAYTQRAILKRQEGDVIGSRADFEMGAKLGNPIAKNIAVNENPYSKLCNQIMMEVMSREMNKGPDDQH